MVLPELHECIEDFKNDLQEDMRQAAIDSLNPELCGGRYMVGTAAIIHNVTIKIFSCLRFRFSFTDQLPWMITRARESREVRARCPAIFDRDAGRLGIDKCHPVSVYFFEPTQQLRISGTRRT